jgi:hypothetical protein
MSVEDAGEHVRAALAHLDEPLRAVHHLCAAEDALRAADANGADPMAVQYMRGYAHGVIVDAWLGSVTTQAVTLPDAERWALYRTASDMVWGCRARAWRAGAHRDEIADLATLAEGLNLAIGAPLA